MKAKKTRELYLTISAGCSPTVEMIFDEGTEVGPSDAPKIAKDVEFSFREVLKNCGGKVRYLLAKGLEVSVHPRTDMELKTKVQRIKERKEKWDEFRDSMPVFKIDPLEERIEKDPNKDKEGYWVVRGMRHSCIVWAKGGKDAIKLAEEKGGVGIDWELCTVEYVGEKPEVIQF